MKLALKIVLPLIFVAIVLTLIFVIPSASSEDLLFVKTNHLSKNVNDKFNVIDACGISFKTSDKQKPFFKSLNSEVIEIGVLTGQAKCVGEGSAKIVVSLKVSDDSVMEKEISVDVTEKQVYPTSVKFEFDKVTIYGDEPAINKLVMSSTTLTPRVYSKNGFASYDYKTGEVRSSQDDVIFLEIAKSKDEKFVISFSVHVEKVKEIKISKTLIVGQISKITYQSYLDETTESSLVCNPSLSNQDIVSIIEHSYGYVLVIANSVGQSLITIKSEKFTIIITVTVV